MRSATRTAGQGSEGQKYALIADDGEAWGFAQEADGLFTVPPQGGGARRVHLRGCRPQGGLLKSTDRVGTRRAEAGNAWFVFLDARGATLGDYFVNDVTVVDVRTSALGDGRVDLGVTLWCEEALPGSGELWDLIRAGRLNRTGMWHEPDVQDGGTWLSVALRSREYRRRGSPDASAGEVFDLDGGHVVDRDSFFCAIGEAVNGPCGYFGWNLDALIDCLRGGWGATTPFTLRWDSSATARARLTERVPTGDGAVPFFDVILDILEETGVRVVLR